MMHLTNITQIVNKTNQYNYYAKFLIYCRNIVQNYMIRGTHLVKKKSPKFLNIQYKTMFCDQTSVTCHVQFSDYHMYHPYIETPKINPLDCQFFRASKYIVEPELGKLHCKSNILHITLYFLQKCITALNKSNLKNITFSELSNHMTSQAVFILRTGL